MRQTTSRPSDVFAFAMTSFEVSVLSEMGKDRVDLSCRSIQVRHLGVFCHLNRYTSLLRMSIRGLINQMCILRRGMG